MRLERVNIENNFFPLGMSYFYAYMLPSPRPPQPLSATLTEEEACTIIQAHFRGYRGRRLPEAQLFR